MSMSHAELALDSESPLHSLSLEWVSPTSAQHGPLLRAMLWATLSMVLVAFLLELGRKGEPRYLQELSSAAQLYRYAHQATRRYVRALLPSISSQNTMGNVLT